MASPRMPPDEPLGPFHRSNLDFDVNAPSNQALGRGKFSNT
jgi:hypothetical protein